MGCDMEGKIKELFATILNINEKDINGDTNPQKIENWDSMQHLILVSGFEEEFKINIEPEEAVEMYKDFNAFKTIVMQKLNGG
jgi:acyl carrier protein